MSQAIAGADFSIVLVEKARTSTQDGKLQPRGNIIDEIERLRLQVGDRFMVLMEQEVELPSNLSTAITWESFDEDHFDSGC